MGRRPPDRHLRQPQRGAPEPVAERLQRGRGTGATVAAMTEQLEVLRRRIADLRAARQTMSSQVGQSSRVEVRTLDAACNPYLAFALMLSAGLKGIEEDYELPAETEDDVWGLTSAERQAMGIEPLPTSLYEAIRVMETSELAAETLGEHVFDFFLRNKRAEFDEYRRQVTPLELSRLLPVL